jgi:hypothetical protein
MDAYSRNINRVLSGQPKRPTIKRNGEKQSDGNIKFRKVHLVPALAVKHNWEIEHFPLENCEKSEHTKIEKLRIKEFECNLNGKGSWYVEEFDKLAKEYL